ncbi:phycobilisome rod-core linker polypeptide [Leptolyngbyaceae cyanobacterium UHCC 1019]
MNNTFVNPVVNPEAGLGVSAFDETDPVRLWQERSDAEVDLAIRAVYRQVLGNAHVMESERLTVPESKLRRGELSVREFVRQVAKSELYRSRFFDNCYRYRAIELNFKHLLGRAPDSFDEMRDHSAILDQAGFEDDIDSYLDSEEYQQVFGEDIVPYYRGYKTQTGQSLLEVTNMLQLLRGASSSDRDLQFGNRPRLTRSLLRNQTSGGSQTQDVSMILADVFKPSAQPTRYTSPISASLTAKNADLHRQQADLIATLQRQLADLRPFASMGSAITQQGKFASSSPIESQSSFTASAIAATELEQQIDQQKSQITSLQQQLAEARSLAAIGEARLNKWRQRTFF